MFPFLPFLQTQRRCNEAKDRCIRLSITLEETRACVEKLMLKVDPEHAAPLNAASIVSKQASRTVAPALTRSLPPADLTSVCFLCV